MDEQKTTHKYGKPITYRGQKICASLQNRYMYLTQEHHQNMDINGRNTLESNRQWAAKRII